MTSAADTVEFPLCGDLSAATMRAHAQLSGLWLAERQRKSLASRLVALGRRLFGRVCSLWPRRPGQLQLPAQLLKEPAPSASSTMLHQLSYAAMIDAMLPPEDSPRPRNRQHSAPLDVRDIGTLLYAKTGVPEPVALAFDDTKPRMTLGSR